MTVSGSSNMMTLMSSRTSPRPMEIFCLLSGDRPAALVPNMLVTSSMAAMASTRARTVASLALRFAQGKGEIVIDAHGVVDDGELEHLRDVALGGLETRHIPLIKQDLPFRGDKKPRDNVEQG